MKNIIKIFLVFTLMLSSCFLTGCSTSKYPPKVSSVLEKAGDNRGELEKAIVHFQQLGDSLKLEAVYYLLSNIESHNYRTFNLVDSSENVIEFNILDFPDFETLITHLDSIEKALGELDFKPKDKAEDIKTITGDFLINNVESAYEVWMNKPWAQGQSFENFCEYILPYRGSSEPLEAWRSHFIEKYREIESKIPDPANPIQAASFINDDIMSWFKFDSRYYLHPTDQGLSEMLETGMGRCEDMTNLTIFAMRANGLAVTSDFTPYWANTGNNHAWNAIVTPDGKVIPFMGAECNPGKYKLANRLAKVYRKMFSEQPSSLGMQGVEKDKLPPYLASKSIIDVTADYVDVTDVEIRFIKVPEGEQFAYLCVFNSGKWKAIQWTEIVDEKAIFNDMGMDIAYLPAVYTDKEIVPLGDPFILDTDGSRRELIADEHETATLTLVSTTKRKQVISTDGIAEAHFKEGTEYELKYWKDGWQEAGKTTAGKEPLVFDDVPQNGLYWLVAAGSDEEERMFTYENGEQVWW
ncbi:MAG: transglutaminase domain-containing protein [FCB group bacterium]|nr:transglutaminase domain-containing protein [FCB group bacterium]